ncbi:MAG: tRNA (adenosine(37)-N6)-threonylcarbamoyltransferase complex dimerization subunit type 1 TsaB [Saprospirales bacterium]|nr:tRNA (adenosine(37)-N6)-threonylcarbamoyltransferase complex dimerization subunit type 1 TsaB [Saprospirales bacterium]
MSRILLIESATAVCSVALSEGGQLLSLQEVSTPNEHGKVMTRLIERCMAESGTSLHTLDAVALSAGPGSYTALRVGAATAKGICFALGKPLIKVDTLQSLAWGMAAEVGDVHAWYCPMIDARRMEVYTAIYNAELEIQAPVQALIVEPDSFDPWINAERQLIFSGDGAAKCTSILSKPGTRFIDIKIGASFMVALAETAFGKGQFEDVAYFSPTYLKPPNITTSKKKWWGDQG